MSTPTRSVIQTTLATALAGSGTLSLSYPVGTNAGSFLNGVRHQLVTAANDVFKAPKYFTLSYGATTITLTWASGSPTIPAGTKLFIQLDRSGASSQNADEARQPGVNNTVDVGLKLVKLGAPLLADADGIAASQSVAAGASFTLNGALLSAIATGRMILESPRNVVASWTTTSVLTITGKDEYGNTVVEQSASGTSHTGKKAFKEITSVSSSASITSATVGTGDVLGLPVFLPAVGNILGEYRSGVTIAGNKEKVYVQGMALEADVDAGQSIFLAAPCAGYITKAHVVSNEAVTTGGTITVKLATVAVVGLDIVVADGGGAGVYDSDTPTSPVGATGLVAAGDLIEVAFPAAFNASSDLYVTLEITPIYSPVGTVVPGKLDAIQSATTGDVRGTYAPPVAPDSTTSYSLLLALPDPDFLGDDQYAG